MPYSSFISSELANLATSLNQAVDGPIYINKTKYALIYQKKMIFCISELKRLE